MINLGIIGEPSSWLIGSHVNKDKVKENFDITLIDIDINELISLSTLYIEDKDLIISELFSSLKYDEFDLKKLMRYIKRLKYLLINMI